MKTYLRKSDLAKRWGVVPRTITRRKKAGTIPPPNLRLGAYDLWSDELIEEFEAANRPPSSESEDSPADQKQMERNSTNSA
jgi:hypothetical protein